MDQNGGKDEFQYTAQPAAGAQAAPSIPSTPAPEPIAASQEEPPLVQWKASEFIDHQKSPAWFFPLIIGMLLLSGGIYLLTRDILATAVILLGGAAFGVYARQKPRTLTYTLLPESIKVGQRSYSYDDFRTFSIIQDGALFSIFLQPVKRFMPPLTIYFDPEDGDEIFEALSMHLPHQEREQDPVERLMRKIRF